MNISTDDHTLIHMLGYISIVQWADALQPPNSEGLDKDTIYALIGAMDKMYGGMREAVDEYIKEQVVKRLEG